MATKVGQTISAQDYKKLYGVGTTVSADQFNKMYGEQQQPAPTKSPNLFQTIFSSGTKIAQDVGAGLALRGKEGQDLKKAQQDALTMANKAAERAAKETDPAKKAALLKVATQATETISGGAKDIAGLFSSDINKSPIERGLSAGAEIATAADLVSGLVGSPAIGAFKAPSTATGAKGFLERNITGFKPTSQEGVLGFLRSKATFGQIGKQTQKLVDEASQKGVKVDYGKILDEANKSPIAKTTAGRKAIAKIWSEFAPAEITGSATPAELHAATGTIRETYGSSLFKNIMAEPKQKLETKAAEVVRRAISKQVHDLVPEVKAYDDIVSFYNKGGYLLKGDIPQKIKKAAIALWGAKYGKQILQSLFYTTSGK